MTIDKEQLISLLIDKTGLEPEQVESQLSELINRIQQAAQEGKTFEVEGFGVFSMEAGNLHFEPHSTLQTEINNKYAGMKPIELIGAFKEPEGDEVPEIVEETPALETSDAEDKEDERWAFDESAAEEDDSPIEETPKPEEVESAEREEEPESEEDFEEIFGTKEEKAADPLQEKLATQEEATSAPESEKETDTLGRILVAAVVVIALGVGGWFIYDIGFSDTGTFREDSPVATQQTGDMQQEVSNASPSQSSPNNKTSEPEQQKEVVKQEGSQAQTEQQPTFGLRGTIDQSAGGYTIVVHSLRSMQRAESNRQALKDQGYRALISEAQVGGRTQYRVGIGQFETVSKAQQAMSDLPSRYRENNFINRIQ